MPVEIFAENADRRWIFFFLRSKAGRRYLIALSCKEAEIFILKVFIGKTRLVFFARRQRLALKGLITMRTIDERSLGKKKLLASDLLDIMKELCKEPSYRFG